MNKVQGYWTSDSENSFALFWDGGTLVKFHPTFLYCVLVSKLNTM